VSVDRDGAPAAPDQNLSTDRITHLRTVTTAHILQMVDDLGPCDPKMRELANRLAETLHDKQAIRRLSDELDRYEIRFGPLP